MTEARASAAESAWDLALACRQLPPDDVVEAIVETMVVYPGDQKSQPKAMLDVQLTGGILLGMAGPHVRGVAAATWKGQMSDAATWGMIRRALSPDETEVARACGVLDKTGSLGRHSHHGLEAVGIGLWSLWRI